MLSKILAELPYVSLKYQKLAIRAVEKVAMKKKTRSFKSFFFRLT